jgi:hypothetical protein
MPAQRLLRLEPLAAARLGARVRAQRPGVASRKNKKGFVWNVCKTREKHNTQHIKQQLTAEYRTTARHHPPCRVREHVFPADGVRLEALPAQVARVLGVVLLRVRAQPVLGGERLPAPGHLARERVQPQVDVLVLLELRRVIEARLAPRARTIVHLMSLNEAISSPATRVPLKETLLVYTSVELFKSSKQVDDCIYPRPCLARVALVRRLLLDVLALRVEILRLHAPHVLQYLHRLPVWSV